mgnify:CR=1 FL=1
MSDLFSGATSKNCYKSGVCRSRLLAVELAAKGLVAKVAMLNAEGNLGMDDIENLSRSWAYIDAAIDDLGIACDDFLSGDEPEFL